MPDEEIQLSVPLSGDEPAGPPAPERAAAPAPVADVTRLQGPLKTLMDSNFLQYASYVVRDRAIPDLADGLKPVQRRILYSLHEKDDGRFIKVSTITGHCMQYHPHGDASIIEALVALVNRRYLVEGQGNFGNLLTGDPAAAARYIECRLTDLAREELFNDELTDFVSSYDGRGEEPVTLPARIPLLLMLGAEGIAVGLATRVLPHNFPELLEAQIAILTGKPFAVYPDFPQGGIMDVSGYDRGRGHVRVRAAIEKRAEDLLVITEIPFSMTTDSLIASIEDAARKKKIRIRSINDFTSERIEIAVSLAPGMTAEKALQALYAFTGCEVQVPSRIVVIRDRRPVEMTVDEVLRASADRLLALLKLQLQLERKRRLNELHARTLVQVFIEQRIYKQIEECASSAEMQQAIVAALTPFRERLRRDVTQEDVAMLLDLRIKRIARFDLEKNRQDLADAQAALARAEASLRELVPFAVRYLRGLLKKYGPEHPRRTRIAAFEAVAVRELTSSELTIRYDRATGYLGHAIGGEALFECSSLDKLVVVWSDGRYKLIAPPGKLFADHNVACCGRYERDRVMTVIYTDEGLTYLKRFTFGGLILNKLYHSLRPGAQIRFISDRDVPELYVEYAPGPGVKISRQVFSPAEAPVQAARARGWQMTAKEIVRLGTARPADWDDAAPGRRGKLLKVMG